MQMLIQVACSKQASLRKAIATDSKVRSFGLRVAEQKRSGRNPGWLKVHSSDRNTHGAINIEWIPSTRVALCRVVTRGGDPSTLVGLFVTYLVGRFGSRIQTINILKR